jgi:hypothetical protein
MDALYRHVHSALSVATPNLVDSVHRASTFGTVLDHSSRSLLAKNLGGNLPEKQQA